MTNYSVKPSAISISWYWLFLPKPWKLPITSVPLDLLTNDSNLQLHQGNRKLHSTQSNALFEVTLWKRWRGRICYLSVPDKNSSLVFQNKTKENHGKQQEAMLVSCWRAELTTLNNESETLQFWKMMSLGLYTETRLWFQNLSITFWSENVKTLRLVTFSYIEVWEYLISLKEILTWISEFIHAIGVCLASH